VRERVSLTRFHTNRRSLKNDVSSSLLKKIVKKREKAEKNKEKEKKYI
jgi:hypothetical protein